MKLNWVLIAFMLTLPQPSPSQWPHPAQSRNPLGTSKDEVRKALESGEVVLTQRDEDYFLEPSKTEGGTQSEQAWSYGDRALLPTEGLRVEIQIGLYKGKRVFLPVAVSKEKGQAGIEALVQVLDATLTKGEKVPGQPAVQACTGKKRCVKWCKDEKGKEYCCRYECITQ